MVEHDVEARRALDKRLRRAQRRPFDEDVGGDARVAQRGEADGRPGMGEPVAAERAGRQRPDAEELAEFPEVLDVAGEIQRMQVGPRDDAEDARQLLGRREPAQRFRHAVRGLHQDDVRDAALVGKARPVVFGEVAREAADLAVQPDIVAVGAAPQMDVGVDDHARQVLML